MDQQSLFYDDNNRVTGLHKSYPRVIACSQFGSNEYVFYIRDLPLLYATIGGSLNILLSKGCC